MGNYDNRNKKKWFLVGELKDGKAWTIPIIKTPFIIGRREDCDLSLQSKNISRRHAEIDFNGKNLVLKDLGSTNGTFLNNKRLKDTGQLTDGDNISFANVKFRISLNEENRIKADSGTFYINVPFKQDNFVKYYNITNREKEILYCILQGKSTKMIADSLCITEGTAKNHVLNIFKKTGVHSRFELFTVYNNFNVTESL